MESDHMRWLRTILLAVWVCAACLPVLAAEPDTQLVEKKSIVIDVPSVKAKKRLGFGWGHRCRAMGKMVRWISRMEGEFRVKLVSGQAYKIEMTAAPQYLHYRRQNIGIYVNNHFVSEWVFPDDPGFTDFEAVIPGKYIKDGKNVIVFRVGYLRHIRPNPKEIAVAVHQIVLTPI